MKYNYNEEDYSLNTPIKLVQMDETNIEYVYDINKLSLRSPWSLESLRAELTNKLARYVVAKSLNSIVGFGGMWIIGDEAHITNIAVHPEFRRSGIGAHIVKTLLHICTVEAVEGITLEVRESNNIAQKLYSKYGFITEGIRKGYYLDTGENGLIMWNRNLNKKPH